MQELTNSEQLMVTVYGMVVLYGLVGYFVYEIEKMYWNDWSIS